ncbi:MAG: hypothetical protein LBH86_03680 [Oscillospiraceae bacterium]|jgi:hypothetical protein|nr:hypothetical protein [Oscillospiraceae bacterium]
MQNPTKYTLLRAPDVVPAGVAGVSDGVLDGVPDDIADRNPGGAPDGVPVPDHEGNSMASGRDFYEQCAMSSVQVRNMQIDKRVIRKGYIDVQMG